MWIKLKANYENALHIHIDELNRSTFTLRHHVLPHTLRVAFHERVVWVRTTITIGRWQHRHLQTTNKCNISYPCCWYYPYFNLTNAFLIIKLLLSNELIHQSSLYCNNIYFHLFSFFLASKYFINLASIQTTFIFIYPASILQIIT